jgi:hypothetical protein
MTEITPVTRQVSIDELGRYCGALHRALQETGLAPEPAAQILEQCLATGCTQCGLVLSGKEALSLAIPPCEPSEPPPNPKMQRLAQGYCGRAACDSRFYEVRLTPYPEINWPDILEQKQTSGKTLTTASAQLGTGLISPQESPTQPKRKTLLIVSLAILVALILIRLYFFGGSISGFAPEPKFQIDPSSLRNHQR